jgi:hypothetical protein
MEKIRAAAFLRSLALACFALAAVAALVAAVIMAIPALRERAVGAAPLAAPAPLTAAMRALRATRAQASVPKDEGNKSVILVPPELPLTEAMPADEIVIGNVSLVEDGTGKATAVEIVRNEEESGGKHKVVKQRSAVDNKHYFVSATLPDRERAADILAEVHRRSQAILHSVHERLAEGRPILAKDGLDITANMQKLDAAHWSKDVPMGEYHAPLDKTVASNAEKGAMLEICLRSKFEPHAWNSLNSITRVYIHELAHSADFHFRGDGDAAHGPDFYRLMNFLLDIARDEGVYDCEEYKRSNGSFCGLKLTETADCS